MELLNIEIAEITDVIKNEIVNILRIDDIFNLLQVSKFMNKICNGYIKNKNRDNSEDHLYRYNKKCIPLYLRFYKITSDNYLTKNKDQFKYSQEHWNIQLEFDQFESLKINFYIIIKLILEKYKDFVEMNDRHFDKHASEHGYRQSKKKEDCVKFSANYDYYVTYKIIEWDREIRFLKLRGCGSYGGCYWGCGNITIKY